MLLKENEVIDNLNIAGLKIIQDNTGFKYGTDAVLLSKFANVRKGARVLDFCTGSGIIPLLLWGLKEPSYVVGVEYFLHIADMAKRSVELNNLSDKIEILNEDVKNYKKYIPYNSFDHVTVNPPYKVADTGFVNDNSYKTCARHEVLLTLADCVEAAEYALKFGGKLTMVNRIDRLSDVFYQFKINKIEPKRVAFPVNSEGKGKIFVLEGIKGGKSGMTMEAIYS